MFKEINVNAPNIDLPDNKPFQRILNNLGFLIKGRGIAAIMSFGSTLLMAGVLEPENFGKVILILAYILLIRGLFDFQLSESIIRFGVKAEKEGDTNRLRRLINICWRIDLIVAIVATIIGGLFASITGYFLNWTYHDVLMLQGYSLVLLSTGNGTSTGILRFLDRFDLLGKIMTIGSFIRFIGVTVLWWFNAEVEMFLVIIAVAYITENFSMIWFGWREYKNKIGEIPLVKGKKTGNFRVKEFEGLRAFLWINYWQSNLDITPKHLVVMLAGYLLGASEAGLLRLARELSSLLTHPANLLRQVLFIDLSRISHQENSDLKLVTYRTALGGGLVGFFFVLISWFFGNDFLYLSVGQEYVAAAPLLTLLLLAATFDLVAASLRSAAYAIGYASKVLRVYIISTIIYISCFAGFTSWFGLVGAGFAACASTIFPTIMMFMIIKKSKLTVSKTTANITE